MLQFLTKAVHFQIKSDFIRQDNIKKYLEKNNDFTIVWLVLTPWCRIDIIKTNLKTFCI